MKAFVRIDSLNQEVKLQEVPLPKFQLNEVLIKVEAFGVGIHDRYYIPADAKFPYVIGTEGSGIISKIGSDVKDFSIGDRVIFTTVLQNEGGCWAEYAVAKQSSLIHLPNRMSFAQGAAIPIAGKTSLECMRELDLNHNDMLFIGGASGAIGTFIIQLAALKGALISASASEKNHSYMKSLGAEETVDYNDPDWKSKIIEWSKGGVNAALAIQPETGIECVDIVKDGGKLITVSGYSDNIPPERNILIKQLEHEEDTQKKVIDLVNSISNGEIKLVIENEYSFDKALEALAKTETRHARGKLVVNC